MASDEGPYPWWSNLVIAAHEQNCTTELLAWREIAALRATLADARALLIDGRGTHGERCIAPTECPFLRGVDDFLARTAPGAAKGGGA